MPTVEFAVNVSFMLIQGLSWSYQLTSAMLSLIYREVCDDAVEMFGIVLVPLWHFHWECLTQDWPTLRVFELWKISILESSTFNSSYICELDGKGAHYVLSLGLAPHDFSDVRSQDGSAPTVI